MITLARRNSSRLFRAMLVTVLLLACVVLLPSNADAISITVRAATVEGATDDEVEIPIEVVDGEEIGALRVDLLYDPAILEPISVGQGELTETALVDFNASEPGRVVMGFVTLDNVAGDGSVMVARFKVIGTTGQSSTLDLENARAWEGDETRFDIAVTAESGMFTVNEASSFPWLYIIIAIIVLLLLLLLLLMRQWKRQPAPPAVAAAMPVAAAPTGSAGQIFCTRCGTAAAVGTRFCGSCGQPFSE